MNIPSCSKEYNQATCYAVVRNIPSKLRSNDLRGFFSFYVENEKFECFHYKHRPETILNPPAELKSKPFCCIVRFASPSLRSEFIKDYHGQQWLDGNAMPMPQKCIVEAVKISESNSITASSVVTERDLKEMVELRPPGLMPQGNVGTPTSYFMEQIRLCRMPPTVIKKLGLKTQKRIGKFGAVPFQYAEKGKRSANSYSNIGDDDEGEIEDEEENAEQKEEDDVVVDLTAPDPLDPTEEYLKQLAPDNDEGADDDNDQCEEWERHEAIYNDVTEQDRTKERNYEPELELVWEKGGPGLVWHTDKNFWAERELGDDCDWKWADDWDVDYSVYYEGKSAGTIDGRQAVEIREDQARWAGKLHDTVFRDKPELGTKRKRQRRPSDSDLPLFHSSYGSRLMAKMGWTPGQGLGVRNQGKIEPAAIQVLEDSNIGKEKSGVGFRGEAIQRTGFKKKKEHHAISSAYDRESEFPESHHRLVIPRDETSERLLRSSEPTTMKYRSRLVHEE